MNKEIEYWKWKNTIIDFKNISDEKIDYDNYHTKKDWVFYYLGCPDEEIHEWYNGGFSSEYNTALRYAKELGLVEDYRNYEEEAWQLQNNWNELKDYLKEKMSVYEQQEASNFYVVLNKMQEIESRK